jgi:hypothetical protein
MYYGHSKSNQLHAGLGLGSCCAVDAQARASPSPAGVPPYEDHARAAAARRGVVGPTPGGPAPPPRASPKAKASHRDGVHVCALRRSTRPGRATYVTSDALRGACLLRPIQTATQEYYSTIIVHQGIIPLAYVEYYYYRYVLCSENDRPTDRRPQAS